MDVPEVNLVFLGHFEHLGRQGEGERKVPEQGIGHEIHGVGEDILVEPAPTEGRFGGHKMDGVAPLSQGNTQLSGQYPASSRRRVAGDSDFHSIVSNIGSESIPTGRVMYRGSPYFTPIRLPQ